jgi:hypothetical protein
LQASALSEIQGVTSNSNHILLKARSATTPWTIQFDSRTVDGYIGRRCHRPKPGLRE